MGLGVLNYRIGIQEIDSFYFQRSKFPICLKGGLLVLSLLCLCKHTQMQHVLLH